uniref:hypothetical protein n=1 Tax=Arenibacterium sp. S380 TaxID=3415138 RepID=UPI003C7CB1E7
VRPEEISGVSRRTIVKGAAWSVPVIAVAAAVPGAAASGRLAAALTIPGGCVAPGGGLPAATVSVTDESGPVVDATVTFTFASSDGGTVTIDGKVYPTPNATLTLAPGEYALQGVTATTAGTVLVTATASTPDGRSATSTAQGYEVCAPQTSGTVFQTAWLGEQGTVPVRPNATIDRVASYPTAERPGVVPAFVAGIGAAGTDRAVFGTADGGVFQIRNAAAPNDSFFVNFPTPGTKIVDIKVAETADVRWGKSADGKLYYWSEQNAVEIPTYTFNPQGPWTVGHIAYVTAVTVDGQLVHGSNVNAWKPIAFSDPVAKLESQEGGDRLWILAQDGTLLYYDNDTLTPTPIAVPSAPGNIVEIRPGAGANVVAALLSDGSVAVYDGTTWRSASVGEPIRKLVVQESNNVWYAVAESGSLYRVTPTTATKEPIEGVADVSAGARLSVFVVKNDGTWWQRRYAENTYRQLVDNAGAATTVTWMLGVNENDDWCWALA